MPFYFHAYNAAGLGCQRGKNISPSQYCEGLRHLSSYCMCISDARIKDVKRLCGQKLNPHNVSCEKLSGHYGSHTSKMVNCDCWKMSKQHVHRCNWGTNLFSVQTELGVLCCYGLYCSFAHPQWGHTLQRPKTWWISGGSQSFCPAPILIFLVIYAFFSSLIGSWFDPVTFLLRRQVYFRHAYLCAHDDRCVWITAERRLVLTWCGR